MQTMMVYSEAGGVSKTTSAVSIAMTAAQGVDADPDKGLPAIAPRRVGLIDLDPRAASTKWTRVEPLEEWQHVGAIIASPTDATGTAVDIALQSKWMQMTLYSSCIPLALQASQKALCTQRAVICCKQR